MTFAALPACSGAGVASTRARGLTTPAPVVVPPVPSGSGAALGLKWDWDRVDAYAPWLRGLPGGDTFYELVWCDVEPKPGQPDWSRIDDVVDGAARVGFRTGLKIRVGSCWATDQRLDARGKKQKTASLLPTDLDAYRQFVQAVVTRYAPRGVHAYAIENEVNGEGFWGSSPEDFDRLARVAAAEIRHSDPKAVVLDGGISSTAYGEAIARWLLDQGRAPEAIDAYTRYYDRRFDVRGDQLPRVNDAAGLEAALKGDQATRNLAFLATSLRLAHDGVVDAWQLHFYERWDNVPLLLEYLRAHLPAGMPIESWETGLFWSGAPDDLAALATETKNTVSLLLAGGVRTVIWLPAANNPGGKRAEEIRWGLFDPDGHPRPAADVFKQLALTAAGAAGTTPTTGRSG